jgi:hypothetical protein
MFVPYRPWNTWRRVRSNLRMKSDFLKVMSMLGTSYLETRRTKEQGPPEEGWLLRSQEIKEHLC